VDLTAAMVRRAEQKAQRTGVRNNHLSIGDAYDLPFADATFDTLINNYMFDLMPERDFEDVLKEFYRVLRP
jgi:ubiquinone/menaquinone biosynthesis C-methylase UbiE